MQKYLVLFCCLLTWRSASSFFCTSCQCNNETELKSMSVNYKKMLRMGLLKCNVNISSCYLAYMKQSGYVYRGCGSCAKFLRIFGLNDAPDAAVCTECNRENCNNQVYHPKIFQCYTCEKDGCEDGRKGLLVRNCSRMDKGCSVYNLTNRETVRACGLCADIAKVSYNKIINCKDCTLDVCNNKELMKARALRKQGTIFGDVSSSGGSWGCYGWLLDFVLLRALNGYLVNFVSSCVK